MNCPHDDTPMRFHPYGDKMSQYKSNVLDLPAPCNLWMCPRCEIFYTVEPEELLRMINKES